MGFWGFPLLVAAVVWLWLSQRDLRKRLTALEWRITDGEPGVAAPAEDVFVPAPTDTPPARPAAAGPSTGATRDPEPSRAPGPPPDRTPPSIPDTPHGSPAYVFRAANALALLDWLRQNWTLAVAALSLILGGLFMVQYGVERGLLSPRLRILGALALGVALIGAGEWVRRRHGDDSPLTRHLPSSLAGAGIVALFIACLSAHALDGLIGPGLSLAAAALVAAAAILMGWLCAPFLPAIGLLGGMAAPFLVGGSSGDAIVLYP